MENKKRTSPFSWLTMLHTLRPIDRIEDKINKTFTPSDWLISGILFFITIFGAGVILSSTAYNLADEVPHRGGIYIEGVVGTPRFVNPLLAISDADRDLSALVFSGLMRATPDEGLVLDLAERYSVSEDMRTYEFTLRPNISFHDGTPITSADIFYTIQMVKNSEVKSPKRANWEGVEVTVLDERTISFTLQAPFPLFLENTTLGILPKHLWENVQTEEFPFTELNNKPIGSGPYRVHDVKKTASGVPTEYHLRAFNGAGRHPFITSFVLKFYSNESLLTEAYESGEVHAAHSIIPQASTRNSEVHSAIFGRVFGVFFNQNQQEIFADSTVRRALDVALDKKDIVSKVVSGYGVPLFGPLPPQSFSTLSQESEKDSIASARDILSSGGWTQGDDGVWEKEVGAETRRLSFTLTTAVIPELKKASEIVAEQWRALGAEVELQTLEQSDINNEVIRPRKYDALLFGLVVGRELDLFAFWHSSQRNDPGLNIALYANITADKYLEEARSEQDPVIRREKAEKAAEEIASETAAVFLYAPQFVYRTQNGAQGITLSTLSAPSDRFQDVETWYLNTERIWPIFTF
ncbi:hypothetical protein COU15_01270 [Candidatus Kaiserbacteria bacterium CG10_big_fil_rev_8_21_14_0_10_45_20]|uniref:Solute-binding protein family 5 domain-containing protein n=1 Tax=Candidatus Kaiserbacteria bacterium CG10_big_fil_rev_8_21_14_0_10_45_20 TaxID=1974607 RepID=A0A2H0UG09_9BACT|nr:MAG: hypothetical protein COU15_01270 [Candidatus Kaiserbacteria bacterium CG10_big_fil_rev_8_21_14_0_10_45_20]